MILSPDQLRDLAASVGFPDPAKAAAVAMCESYGHSDASNIVTNPGPGAQPERSFGIWQVNTLASPQFDEANLLDPTYNARAAYVVSRGGTYWAPWWNTIQSGCYRQYLPAGYVAPDLPATPPARPSWGVTPPRPRDNTGLAIVGMLALGAAAGYAALREWHA